MSLVRLDDVYGIFCPAKWLSNACFKRSYLLEAAKQHLKAPHSKRVRTQRRLRGGSGPPWTAPGSICLHLCHSATADNACLAVANVAALVFSTAPGFSHGLLLFLLTT